MAKKSTKRWQPPPAQNPRDFIGDTSDMGFTALRVVERLYHIAKPCLATFGGDLH
ncbi:MAG: hypothetical protein U1E92_03385 [Moraxella osloensis]